MFSLQTILLSDSSSSDDDDQKPVTESDLKHMIKQHKYHKRCRQEFRSDPEVCGVAQKCFTVICVRMFVSVMLLGSCLFYPVS